MNQISLSQTDFYKALCPQDRDQGDPYFIEAPKDFGSKFRFYVFTTGEVTEEGRAYPYYGSNDLKHWEFLGGSLVSDIKKSHWAPCVQYVPGLEYPFVMLYSHGRGLNEEAHIGHVIKRAHSKSLDKPFVFSGHELTKGIDFSIDADVYSWNGQKKIAFAMDFINDAPHGTGVVEASISDDLSELTSKPITLARASYEWQVYLPKRQLRWMTLEGVDWSKGDTVKWYTVEAPVGGLISPKGKRVVLYSGGNFANFYAVGALIENEKGTFKDIASREHKFVLRPQPDKGLFALGHPSLAKIEGKDYLMTHMRIGSVDATRQFALVPLLWNEKAEPCCPPLE